MIRNENVYEKYLEKNRNAYLDDDLKWAKSVHMEDKRTYAKNGKQHRKAITGETLKNAERYVKAAEQYNMSTVSVTNIIEYIIEFLIGIGIKDAEVINQKCNGSIPYDEIKDKYNLKYEGDIVWLKFTADGHLGVVARGNDINFNIPKYVSDYHKLVNKDDYKSKKKKQYVYNTSGILLHSVGGKWNNGFVLIIPIKDANICDIETGIGNYLISKNVPIIDYYSHNY